MTEDDVSCRAWISGSTCCLTYSQWGQAVARQLLRRRERARVLTDMPERSALATCGIRPSMHRVSVQTMSWMLDTCRSLRMKGSGGHIAQEELALACLPLHPEQLFLDLCSHAAQRPFSRRLLLLLEPQVCRQVRNLPGRNEMAVSHAISMQWAPSFAFLALEAVNGVSQDIGVAQVAHDRLARRRLRQDQGHR